jgi:triosephosphate isomerase
MYKTRAETRAFFEAFKPLVAGAKHCEIIVAPPFTALSVAIEEARGSAIAISAQDVFWENEGAWTGEVSPTMLVDLGCTHTLIGHSERRHNFNETDEWVNRKLRAALVAGLFPIVCVGETLAEREAGGTEDFLRRQFFGSLAGLTPAEFSRILMAYEPVWAIGTGRTATPDMAAAAHRFLRQLAADTVSAQHAASLRILYGGSVKPENCRALLAEEEIDGALVGGASLDPRAFSAIVNG